MHVPCSTTVVLASSGDDENNGSVSALWRARWIISATEHFSQRSTRSASSSTTFATSRPVRTHSECSGSRQSCRTQRNSLGAALQHSESDTCVHRFGGPFGVPEAHARSAGLPAVLVKRRFLACCSRMFYFNVTKSSWVGCPPL